MRPAALSFVTGLLPDADVHMVQAVAIGPQLEQATLRVGLARRDLSTHYDVLVQDAQARFGAQAEKLQPPVTWRVLRGDPALELARATHDPDVDLIAPGPNRTGLLQRVFDGGVTRQLLRNAGCVALIGRPLGIGMPDDVAQREPTADQSANPLLPLAT